jgi:8-oxo-dGTP diphosphatase
MQETTLVAKVFIINSEGLILALRRSRTDPIRPRTWDLPGGGVEYGEDPTDAVIRETDEEVGLKIENPQIFSTNTTSGNKYVIRLLYYAYTKDKTIKLSFEHDKYEWVTRDEFSNLDAPDHYKNSARSLPD